MEFGDGNVTVSDASGDEMTVVEVSENGTDSYVVKRHAAEFEIRAYDKEETKETTVEKNISGYHVERVENDAVKVIESTEMENESLKEANGTVKIEVEDGGEDGEGTR